MSNPIFPSGDNLEELAKRVNELDSAVRRTNKIARTGGDVVPAGWVGRDYPVLSGRWYLSMYGRRVGGTLEVWNPTDATCRMQRCYFPSAAVAAGLKINVASIGKTVELGLAKAGTDGLPTGAILSSGNLVSVAGGDVSWTFAPHFEPEQAYYWLFVLKKVTPLSYVSLDHVLDLGHHYPSSASALTSLSGLGSAVGFVSSCLEVRTSPAITTLPADVSLFPPGTTYNHRSASGTEPRAFVAPWLQF